MIHDQKSVNNYTKNKHIVELLMENSNLMVCKEIVFWLCTVAKRYLI